MTAVTAQRPVPAAEPTRARRTPSLERTAELALVLVTLATAAGLARLYRHASFFAPLALVAVVGHALAAWCRRRVMSAASVTIVATVSGVILSAWLFFPSATSLGIPTPHTFGVATTALAHAWGRFGTIIAPGPVLPGFQLSAALAIWAAAWFSDWSAFRLGAAVESVVPAGALFMFASLLGSRPHRLWATTIFAVAVLLFVLAHRLSRQEGTGTWLTSAPSSGRRSLLQVGIIVVSVAIVGGALLGPAVPGAHEKALLPYRPAQDASGTRITVSPLVNIRKRLVNQSDEEAFTVQSDQPSYWRLTSLDTFDGRIWSSGGSFAPADDQLPLAAAPPPGPRITQDFTITGLSAIWVPAAFEATSITSGETKLSWDIDSSTLIVSDDHRTSDNIRYHVVSHSPRFDKNMLLQAREAPSAAIGQKYLQLPPGFDRSDAAKRAHSITDESRIPYDKALALQDYFRTFTYDLTVPEGHGEDAIVEFLSSRRGYCEQFAGTYAAMARSIGLPARVAVGFTPGNRDLLKPDVYHVLGRHSHAWPEVYLADAGWVPFEPTPTRGAPGEDRYAGPSVTPMQDETKPSVTPTVPTSGATGPATPETFPRLPQGRARLDTTGTADRPAGNTGLIHQPLVIVAITLLTLGAAYVVLAVVGPVVRRRRRRAKATTPTEVVALAWDHSIDPVALLAGTAPRRSETHREYTGRVAEPLGALAAAHRQLAELATAASWSSSGPPPEDAQQATALSSHLANGVRAQLGTWRRFVRLLQPRQVKAVLTGRTAPLDEAPMPASAGGSASRRRRLGRA